MRKLIVSNFVTLDGYYEGKDKSLHELRSPPGMKMCYNPGRAANTKVAPILVPGARTKV